MFPLYLFVYFMYNAAPVEREVETKPHSTAALKIEEAAGYAQGGSAAASVGSTKATLYRGSLLFSLLLSPGEREEVSFSGELNPLDADGNGQEKESEDVYLDRSTPSESLNR